MADPKRMDDTRQMHYLVGQRGGDVNRRRVRSAMTKSPNPAPPLATVTSLRYRHDGLHVMAVGYNDRMAESGRPLRPVASRSRSAGRIVSGKQTED